PRSSPCANFTCHNGGSCMAHGSFPVCHCPSQFLGIRCEFGPVDPCGGCPDGQTCVPTGIQCVTSPCPTHHCQ
ncbi:delta-like 4, partial [Elysia marginata]